MQVKVINFEFRYFSSVMFVAFLNKFIKNNKKTMLNCMQKSNYICTIGTIPKHTEPLFGQCIHIFIWLTRFKIVNNFI